MKIAVIHGSQRNGNTEKTIEIVKKKLNTFGNNEFIDFYLPKDLPLFCCGCFQCIEKGNFGGECCPHAKYTQAILDAMKSSDGVIITSPVYSLAESGQVKVLLDHLACIYMNHRPLQEMFSKSAFVISTAAGGGTKHTINAIKRSLDFWGISNIYKCGLNIWAKDWNDMPPKKQEKFEKLLGKKTKKFYKSMQKLRVSLKTKLFFTILRKFINSLPDDSIDKKYWRSKGWLDENKPW